ncbi:MAG: glutamate synthase subunit alpha, partial [Planctomycetes bacterium]|nr:glutamate synthase subunit alpha [Planctomycetota bacterium]
MRFAKYGPPPKQGLYDPKFEHDACGVAFIANFKGKKSNQILKDGLFMLCNLVHRGAVGADPQTGDGAGLLIQMPHEFMESVWGDKLPGVGNYSCGNVFLPKEEKPAAEMRKITEMAIQDASLEFLGWRDLKVDNSSLGEGSLSSEPLTSQILVGKGQVDEKDLELVLYRARKRAERLVAALLCDEEKEAFYINSLSAQTITYKGMFLSEQLGEYYEDLKSDLIKTAVALVHQRFSTNTFPAWKLAHPFRYIAHNGEFNTIEGNINMMKAREYLMDNDVLGEEGIDDLKPIIPHGLSDSASFDCGLELMLHTGRSLPHVMSMMVPEAWGSRKHMNIDRKSFYQYHANLMEPWDGPATIAATDGKQVCAILDRNGLRPARFCVTSDDRVIFASEAGTLPVAEKDIVYKSRLWPGKIIMIDMEKGTFEEDDAVKGAFINKQPYRKWLEDGMMELADLPDPIKPPVGHHKNLHQYQRTFGYTEEELKEYIVAMVTTGMDPVGSMGNDAALAVLSKNAKPLYHYFRQRFAQVTNPAVDPIREELVMGLSTYFGAAWNMFQEGEEYCRQVKIDQPILSNYELEKLAQADTEITKGCRLPILFDPEGGKEALRKALDNLFATAKKKIEEGYNAIILSDRDINSKEAPIPAILAVAGLHHYLIRNDRRGNVGIIVETGDARLVHDMAVLLGYGATAINPYLVFDTIRDLRDKNTLPHAHDANEDEFEDSCYVYDKNYIKAVNKGLMKIMSKMGISTVRSYKGAQIFELLGFSNELVDEFFTGTVSQVEGIGLDEIAKGSAMLHRAGFAPQPDTNRQLDWGGQHKWRPVGETHLMNPESIALMQHSLKTGKYDIFKQFTKKVDDQSFRLATLRGLLKFKSTKPSIPLNEVE